MAALPKVVSQNSRAELLASLAAFLPRESLLSAPEELKPYECDGLTAYRAVPLLAVLPRNVADVQAIMRIADRSNTKVVARGSGTGLSGGATPLEDGMLMSMAKFNRIVGVDPLSRTARVQPGVRNLQISEAVAPLGLYYAPDPSCR